MGIFLVTREEELAIFEHKQKLAMDENTPQDVLMALARDQDVMINWYVLKNPNMPVDALYVFAQSPDQSMRFVVACHDKTPPDILQFLARDSAITVRDKAKSRLI